MFGPRMWIPWTDEEKEESWLLLRPFEKEEMPILTPWFQRMDVGRYLVRLSGATLEGEEEWFEETRKKENSYTWAIVPFESGVPIGVTSIERVCLHGSCESGVVVFNKKWWGKGIAGTTHLARTLFAADHLNRVTIKSWVLTPNIASWKALLRVGYIKTGRSLRTVFIGGKFEDFYSFSWLHPERLSLLYPNGLPNPRPAEGFDLGIKRAQEALDTGREIVRFTDPMEDSTN